MPARLPLLLALLLLSCLLFAVGGAHASPAAPLAHASAFEELLEDEGEEEAEEGEVEETGCETAEGEAAEEELSQDEADEICEEESTEARPAKHPNRGKGKHNAQKHKKACRRKPRTHKRHCRQQGRQDGGSQARHPRVR